MMKPRLSTSEESCVASDQTARIIVAIARQYARPELPIGDLVSDAYLALLKAPAYNPSRGPWSSWVRWNAELAIRDRARSGRRARKSDRITRFQSIPFDAVARGSPEPLSKTVGLFAALSDREAEVITLVCGLDGARRRSLRDVAWMTGLGHQPVNRAYQRGLSKLKTQLGVA